MDRRTEMEWVGRGGEKTPYSPSDVERVERPLDIRLLTHRDPLQLESDYTEHQSVEQTRRSDSGLRSQVSGEGTRSAHRQSSRSPG